MAQCSWSAVPSHGSGSAQGALRCSTICVPPSSTAASAGIVRFELVMFAASWRSKVSICSTVGADVEPMAVMVFSTGTIAVSGTAIVLPGRRARNWA
ncbi:hypothetical protein ATK17_3874 [Branchiibius hedensis]|uniref:Uncharacterized protein n=1 Tax=Branchiibius hedensis TaxID=672460 RepID=A0A2Y9BMX8_9MICO|nr:hypothetical protein ATK17_3874 [Branchiibius hedensis]SSA59063.1 hypothetical protein SAMN04489750_3874 [Branchiibius hedensis]